MFEQSSDNGFGISNRVNSKLVIRSCLFHPEMMMQTVWASNTMGKDAKGEKGKAEAGDNEEGGAKGKGKSGKAADGLGTCTYQGTSYVNSKVKLMNHTRSCKMGGLAMEMRSRQLSSQRIICFIGLDFNNRSCTVRCTGTVTTTLVTTLSFYSFHICDLRLLVFCEIYFSRPYDVDCPSLQ